MLELAQHLELVNLTATVVENSGNQDAAILYSPLQAMGIASTLIVTRRFTLWTIASIRAWK